MDESKLIEVAELIDRTVKKHDNEIISNTISAFENAMYEYGCYDPYSQCFEITRGELQRLMYHISVELKGEE